MEKVCDIKDIEVVTSTKVAMKADVDLLPACQDGIRNVDEVLKHCQVERARRVAGIHGFLAEIQQARRRWRRPAGTSPAMTPERLAQYEPVRALGCPQPQRQALLHGL